MTVSKLLGRFISKHIYGKDHVISTETRVVGNYTLKIEKIDGGNHWDTLKVYILDGDGKELGSYDRNYPSFFDTFCPFMKNGKEYALYSRDYTSTRVMSLPDCEDIGGEERDTFGFCPIEFLVPSCDKFHIPKEFESSMGFVAGCGWGDDTSWKVQLLDLSKVEEGIIKRDGNRLGYIELCSNDKLEDAIADIEVYYDEEEKDWDMDIEIRMMKRYIFQWSERFKSE